MKTFALTSILVTAALVTNAQDFEASSPITVASGFGNYHPQLEVLGDNELGMIWTNAADNQLYFCKRTAPNIFSAPIQLNPAGTEVQDYNWSGPDLCAWENKVYVIYHDLGYETGHVYLVRSDNYGATFSDTVRVDNLTNSYAQFPDVAVYNDTVFVTYMVHGVSTPNPQYYFARSVDGGQSFEPAIDVTSWLGEEVCDCCQPEIIADAERIIVFYRQNDANTRDIKAVVSYDRGATFSQFISVDDHNWVLSACPSTGPDARFLENGNPLCIYRTSVSGQPKLFLNEYDLTLDNSVNLVEVYADGASGAGINYPQLAVDGSLMAIVWEGLGSATDVYFNASNSGVANFLPGEAINVTNITGSQSKPDVAILNGAFHIIYSELSGASVNYVTVHSVNSVTEPSQTAPVAYPNPANEQLTIDLTGTDISSGDLIITDMSGRVIYVAPFINANPIVDVSAWPIGTYIIHLTTSEKKLELHFVKY